MKTLHISALPVWPLEGKGGMPSLRETLHGHVRAGFQVMLALPKYNVLGDYANLVSIRQDEGYQVFLVPCRWAPFLALVRRVARRLGGGKELPYLLRWVLNLALCVLLTVSLVLAGMRLRFIERQKFDFVYAHNQFAALAGWVLGKMFRVPNVTRLYGTFLADLIDRPLVWLRYPVAVAGFLVPHALLICANDGTRGDVVARKLGIDQENFRFWQNGVDLPGTPPKTTRAKLLERYPDRNFRVASRWVLSCSRLSYWKRIDRMLHALKHARDKGCDCQLLVAGDGPERNRLAQLAAELNIAEDIVWLGAVHHEYIWELMHVVDVFMITNDVTNRCNPLFEAICAGLPVVSISDPSTADLLLHEDNSLLVDKGNLEALGDNLWKVCSDAELANRLRRAQQARAAGLWSWRERMETETKELEKLVYARYPLKAGGV